MDIRRGKGLLEEELLWDWRVFQRLACTACVVLESVRPELR